MLLTVLVGCSRKVTPPVNTADAVTLSDVEGVWVLSLTEEEAHRLLIRKLALSSDLPGEPELRTMGMDDADLGLLRQLRALPRDAPQWEVLADEVAHMERGSLTITRRTMRMSLGMRTWEADWSLIERNGDTLVVDFIEDDQTTQGMLRVGLDGTLVLIDSQGNELILERL
jgi:hypothetical protein